MLFWLPPVNELFNNSDEMSIMIVDVSVQLEQIKPGRIKKTKKTALIRERSSKAQPQAILW